MENEKTTDATGARVRCMEEKNKGIATIAVADSSLSMIKVESMMRRMMRTRAFDMMVVVEVVSRRCFS